MSVEGERRRRFLGWSFGLFVLVGAVIAWFLLDPGFRTGETSSSAAENMPAGEFERRVRDYILNNPEVIVAAVRQLQARQQASAAQGLRADRRLHHDWRGLN